MTAAVQELPWDRRRGPVDEAPARPVPGKATAPARATRIVKPANPSGLIEWLDPHEGDELVLDAKCGKQLDTLLAELRAASRFIEAGIDAPTRVLFFGPSGVGKTLAARWIGARVSLPVGMVRLNQIVGSTLGSTAANLGKVFAEASSVASIVFLDEIDGMGANRAKGGEGDAGAEMKRATTALLQQLDLYPPERIVIAATNHRDQLDAALSRRFTTSISFSLPDAAARRSMASRWLAKVRLDDDALDAIAECSEGRSGAFVRTITMAAARRSLMADVPLSGDHVWTAAAENSPP